MRLSPTPRQHPQAARRAAFTLIETLVTLAVIGLLVALLLPAIQAAREAARRSACSNNLRQVGLALASYEVSFGVLPAGSNGRGYSLHSMLLPHLEQRPLFDAINFNFDADDIGSLSPNNTAFLHRIATFLCPSARIQGGTNYAGNRGVGERLIADSGAFINRAASPVGIRDFTDGTSTTAAMSEWVAGPLKFEVKDARGTVFRTPHVLNGPAAFEPFVVECHGIDLNTAVVNNNDKGLYWILGGYRNTLYNHTLPINDPSCVSSGLTGEGAYSASSHHAGGAHTLFADGHARFQEETLALPVWRAQGTRSGREVISQ